MSAVQNKHNSVMPLQTGATVGKYELIEKIGSGATSVVYKARDIALNRTVAIKFLLIDALDGAEFLRRFKQEAKALGTLEHQNIVKVHEIDATVGGAPYIVMNYLDGITLAALLASEGTLSQDRWFTIMLQACAAVEHAHANGIIHRDLKPGNLVLVQENNHEVVKLIDFGIAKNMLEDAALTRTGNVFGTPLYMSPEQCAGEKLDERSDIYSLGCIMYEALKGKAPFVGDNSLDTMQKHLKDVPDPLTTILSKPGENDAKIKALNSVVMKCLEKKPAHRYQKISELRKDLSSLLQGKQPSPRFALPGWQTISIVTIGILLIVIGLSAIKPTKTHNDPDLQNKESMAVTSSPEEPTFNKSSASAISGNLNANNAEKELTPDPSSTGQSRSFRKMMQEARAAAANKNWKLALEKAQECLIAANKLGKGPTRTAEIYWHIAQAEYYLNEYTAAQRDYKLALDAVSNETDDRSKVWRFLALLGMGQMARLNKQYDEAIVLYEKAYKTVQATSPNPDDPDGKEKIQKHRAICMQGIGEVCSILNQTEKARLYWKAALKLWPNNPLLAKQLKELGTNSGQKGRRVFEWHAR